LKYTLAIAWLVCFLEVGAWRPKLCADVTSNSGRIDFRPNATDTKMSVTIEGVGIGVVHPSANLDVAGGFLTTTKLGIGTHQPQSSLEINGTLGFSIENVSDNTTLGDNSIILVDTSDQDIVLTLPYAGNVSGRVYEIKKMSTAHHLTLVTSGGNFENGYEDLLLRNAIGGTYPSVKLISSGNAWKCLNSIGVLGRPNITAGLIRYYKFDENSGNIAYDSSAYEEHGALSNGFSFSGNTGKIGNALYFGGSDNVLSNFGNGRDPSLLHLSASMWVKPTLTTNMFFGSRSVGSNQRVYLGFISNTWTMGIYDNVYAVNPDFPATSNWTHVVVVMDGSKATLYIDGVKGTSSQSVKNYNSFKINTDITIGSALNTYFFTGYIDDVRIYDRALILSEIQALYDLGQ